MALTVQFNPQPFGQVSLVTPGTPVQLAINLPTYTPKVTTAVTDTIPCNKINVTASPLTHAGVGNTSNVFIGTLTMNKTTLAGVLAIITPGGSWSWTHNVGLNIYQFEQWYLDGTTAGDAVFGTFDTV